jgi:hypothetical protein
VFVRLEGEGDDIFGKRDDAGGNGRRVPLRYRKTIYRWMKRKEKGMLAASKNNIRKPKIEFEKLRLHIISHPDNTLKEI